MLAQTAAFMPNNNLICLRIRIPVSNTPLHTVHIGSIVDMTRSEDDDDMICARGIEESDARPDYLKAIVEAVDGLSSDLRRISLEIHGRSST
jgi:hypothetical protein